MATEEIEAREKLPEDDEQRTSPLVPYATRFLTGVLALCVLVIPIRAVELDDTTNTTDTATARLDADAAVARQSPRPPVALWDALFRVFSDGGYRDNVSRTSVSPESSAFVHSGAEVSLIRLSETGTQYSLFLLGEDWRYPDCDSVSSEQLASATTQGLWLVGPQQELGVEAQYLYQNQVIDLSETDAELRRLLVEGHGIWARPRWRWNLNSGWAVQVEGSALRQIYSNEEVDDYWEGAGKLSLVHKYGNRSEFAAYIQSASRFFDSWEQYDSRGVAVTNSSLQYWRPEVGGQFRHFWDKDRRWRTVTKLSYLWNRDNGPGYFDYGRLLFSQQVRWTDAHWEIRTGARMGWYLYDVQRIGDEDRERSYVIVDMRVERRFGRHLFIYGAAESEWDFSNDPLDEYTDWWLSGGVGVEF